MKHVSWVLFILLLIGCDRDKNFDYEIIIRETPTNLGRINSIFDDYNSDLPYPAQGMDIYFSSNRSSRGGEFDIVAGKLGFSYHSDDDVLNVSISDDAFTDASTLLFPNINSINDEFGPYSYYSGDDLLFFYATNPNDTFDIKFAEVTNWNYSHKQVSDPISLTEINKLGDNLYPSIDLDRKKLYLCSNRGGSSFDIYSAVYNSEISKQSLADNDIQAISKESTISSDFDDKCPYVKDNFMVFTSNRDGTYDLWYSKLENDTWTEPLKFDEPINSDYAEYRPVLSEILGFTV